MSLERSKTMDGRPFPVEIREAVWQKASRIPYGGFLGQGNKERKADKYGRTIVKDEYGQETGEGWVIGRLIPKEEGGTDDIGNLQALHWKNDLNPPDRKTE